MLISTATTSLAAPTIGIEDTSPVEIVLTGGDTDFDYEGFADKLKAELIAVGVAEHRIKITASELKSFSSVGDGLEVMKNEWLTFPKGAQPMYNDYHGLRGPVYQISTMHGALCQEKETTGFSYAKINFGGYCPACPAGVSSRVHKNERGNYDFYFASVQPTGDINDWPVRVFLYKVLDAPLSSGITYTANGGDANCGFVPNRMATLVAQSNTFKTYHTGYDGSNFPQSTKFSVSMETKGNTHIVCINDMQVLTYTDTQNPIVQGVPMFGCAYAQHTGLTAAEFTIGAVTPLVDAVRSSDWAANSSRFIVDVCDTEREDFTNNEKVGELVQRMEANGAYYIGWGRTSGTGNNVPSKTSMLNFIAHNSGRGKFFDNYTENQLYRRTAEYIKPIVCSREDLNGRVYLYKDKEYSFN